MSKKMVEIYSNTRNNWILKMLFCQSTVEIQNTWFRSIAAMMRASLQAETPHEKMPKAVHEILKIIQDPSHARDIILQQFSETQAPAAASSSSSTSPLQSTAEKHEELLEEANTFLKRYQTITRKFPSGEELIRRKREHDEIAAQREFDDQNESDLRETEYALNQRAVRMIKSSDAQHRIHIYYQRIIFLIHLNNWFRFHACADREAGRDFDINLRIKQMRAYLIFMVPCAWPEIIDSMETDAQQYPMPNDMFRMMLTTWYRKNGVRLFSMAIDPKVSYKSILELHPTLVDATRQQALTDLSIILEVVHRATK